MRYGAKRILALLLAAGLLLSLGGAAAESGDSEAALRTRLVLRARRDAAAFFRGDYDGDGRAEAFALTGRETGDAPAYEGELWFVSEAGAELLQEGRAYERLGADGRPGAVLFCAEEGYGGSGSTSHLWCVRDGRAQSLGISGLSGFTYAGGDDFYAYPSAFDAASDGTGHTWKRYYYHYDPQSGLREYGGIGIDREQLLACAGAAEILAALDGWEVGEIYCRGNGVINVNLYRRDGDVTRNDNLTLLYDGTGVTDTGERFGGVYRAANTPEIADYPDGFAAPAGGSAAPDPAAALEPFAFDRLSAQVVSGSGMTESDGLQRFRIALRPGVYSGGSEGFYEKWVTAEGVLAEALLDLDGDGADELLTCSPFLDDDSGYAWADVSVSAPEADGFRERARLDRAASLAPMGSSFVRLVEVDGAPRILTGYADIGDGAVADVALYLYGYDGEALQLEGAAMASSYGPSWAALGSVPPAREDDLYESAALYCYDGDASLLGELGLIPGENFFAVRAGTEYDPDLPWAQQLHYDGFEMLNEAFAPAGVRVEYAVSPENYCESVAVTGGRAVLVAGVAWEEDHGVILLDLCTSLDHRPGAPSGTYVPPGEGEGDEVPYGPARGHATGDVRLRGEPNLQGAELGIIPNGAEVALLGGTATDERGVDWYLVEYGGITGWASSKYVVPD